MRRRMWQGAAIVAAAWMVTGALAADEAMAPEAATASATAAAPVSSDDAFNFFLQEAEVVTASRQAQKKSDSPVAIEVITREDIEHSGARNIQDLLRFRVGMDVSESQSIEGNIAEVSVRGLAGEFSQSIQVMIDGRSVLSPLNSGVYWRDLPVGLDDIERIEIVRGPNSALFGANSGQGVINIITRKPDGSQAGEFRGEAGQYGWHMGQVGLNTEVDGLRLRVSLTDRSIGTFPSPQGDTIKNLDSEPLDRRIDARGGVNLWEGGEMELFAGGTDQAYAIPASLLSTGSGYYNEQYYMGQLHQKFGAHSLDVTLSGRQNRNSNGSNSSLETVYDGDALLHLSAMDGAAVTALGVSLRDSNAWSNFVFSGNGGPPIAVENHLRRAYGEQTMSPSDWLTLVAAGSFEDSDLGGQWPSYQGAVILKPNSNHSLRLSAGRSPTMPSMQNRLMDLVLNYAPQDISQQLYDNLVGTYGAGTAAAISANYKSVPTTIHATGTAVLPTQVSSYEATWSSALFDRHLLAEVTGYQMEVAGQIQFSQGSSIVNGTPSITGGGMSVVVPVSYVNEQNLVLRGIETVLTFKPVAGTTVQVNHTYEDVYSDVREPATDRVTPWNKVNLIASTELPFGINVASTVGWEGEHTNYLSSRFIGVLMVPDQAKVDLRLGWKPNKDLELYAVGANLDHAFRTEGEDGTVQPQMYWGGVNLSFGGK